MNVSVIGATGFLGTALRQYLHAAPHTVQVFSKREVSIFPSETFVQADVTGDFPFEKLLQQDMIFYCAGAGVQSGEASDKKKLYYVNTYFPIRLAEYLDENDFKGTLVTFGSYFEIGNNKEDKRFTAEEIIFSKYPVPNAYCVSKRLFTKYVHDNTMHIKLFHLVLPTIYGEHENGNRLIPYIINGIKNGEKLLFTAGNQVRQYLYVNDLVRIIFTIKDQLPAGVHTIPSEQYTYNKDLAYTIGRYFNFPIDETAFAATERADTSMPNLQLAADGIRKLLPGFNYTAIEEVLPKYSYGL